MSLVAWMLGLVCFGLLCLWHRYTQRLSKTVEQSGYHAVAVVKSYRKEYVRVAGSWDWLDYPYVMYENAEGEMVLERLKYAERNRRLLEIGDEIEVVRHDGVLHYRAALHPNYDWSSMLWMAATVSALAAIGSLAGYFTSIK